MATLGKTVDFMATLGENSRFYGNFRGGKVDFMATLGGK